MSTNPNLLPAIGLPISFNEYGTLIILKGAEYPAMFYIDVLGNMAVWSTNKNEWRTLTI